jgi:glycosyltransferase involved in cell wall biosynthesis
MKIGFFTDNYLPHVDGVTISVETCAQALEARGHEVYIIAPRYPRYKDKRKNVHRMLSVQLPKSTGARMALQFPDKSLLKILSIDFDIIHGHPGGSGITFLGLEIARLKNIPHVATYHTLYTHYTHYFFNGKIIKPRMVIFLTKFIGNMCDYMIAPTERVKDALLSYGVTTPIHILQTGIAIENYENVEKGFLRRKLKLPRNKKILLSIARLGKEKSVDFIIESFKFIYEKDNDTVLVLVGDGHEKENLKSLVKNLGLTKSVYFCGIIPHKHIPKVYADADVFVFASQTETQGLVITEALASGLPVVAVADEAFEGVIFNGKNGYQVSKHPGEFAKKVNMLLSDAALYKKFSFEAHRSIQKFSIEKTALYLEQLYEQLIKEKEATRGSRLHRVTIRQFKQFVSQAREQLLNYLEL